MNKSYSYYIGKNGITQNNTDILVVDWRTPVSSIYYECNVGEGSYTVPSAGTIDITLNKKRTYEIFERKLFEFYDTDIVATDELLTKYLSKNKEAVLDEIIATIQKEQNEIIRESPYRSVIVQGVAGSGKTTVAMHRISYILYNYKDFKADELFIIGSNHMLLNYITGILPDLDVPNVEHMTLVEFVLKLLGKELKKSYQIRSDNCNHNLEFNRMKGSIAFVKRLEAYLCEFELQNIPVDNVLYENEIIIAKENIEQFIRIDKNATSSKIDILNKRVLNKVKLINEIKDADKNKIKEEVKNYKQYFGNKKTKKPIIDIYKEFILYQSLNTEGRYQKGYQTVLDQIDRNEFDIYDLTMILLVEHKITRACNYDLVSHIVVDESQDFGVSVFYIPKKILLDCTYTIMGDVSQNINYDTGMNDWEDLKNEVFDLKKDRFCIMAKIYRNTIEISDYAATILRKCSFKKYKIEPIIRHGDEVRKSGIHK